jgi:YegS/Rv2252/BmrU family lipid kinase
VDKRKKQICVILNPTAAKGHARKTGVTLEKKLTELGFDCTFVLTRRPFHAVELALQASTQNFDIIAAAGGDGTVNEVVCGLMQAARKGDPVPRFALFPIGRGNDFAYALRMPKDVDACCQLLIEGRERTVDAGMVTGGLYPNGRCFINGVGIGFEPLVNITASKYKHVSGVLSYLLAFLKVMASYPAAVDIDMEFDGNKRKLSTQQISICNGRRMGGSFLLGPDALIDDGYLDLGYVNRPVTMMGIVKMVGKFFRGEQKSHPYFSSELVKSVDLRSEKGGLVCHADGEVIAFDSDHLHIEIIPRALRLIGSPEI